MFFLGLIALNKTWLYILMLYRSFIVVLRMNTIVLYFKKNADTNSKIVNTEMLKTVSGT